VFVFAFFVFLFSSNVAGCPRDPPSVISRAVPSTQIIYPYFVWTAGFPPIIAPRNFYFKRYSNPNRFTSGTTVDVRSRELVSDPPPPLSFCFMASSLARTFEDFVTSNSYIISRTPIHYFFRLPFSPELYIVYEGVKCQENFPTFFIDVDG